MMPPVGKSGPFHEFQQRLLGRIRLLDHRDHRGAQFAQIVRRNGGRHADGDTIRSIGQQVRKRGGKNDGLFFFAIIGGAEIHRVFIQPFEKRLRDRGEPAFGVTHRGGVIAVDVAEIALPVDQRITHREILCEANERVVNRLVAMRMIFTDDIAHHARAFLETGLRVQAQCPHRPQHPAMHGLQPVARIGQRALRDGGKRISEVTLGKRLGQGFWADFIYYRCGSHTKPSPRPNPIRPSNNALSALLR